MESSYSFFENRSCEYFPCHENLEACNCLFCFCPLYNRIPCPGKPTFITKDDGRIIKRCTDCTFPHKKENYSRIMRLLKTVKPAGAFNPSHGGEMNVAEGFLDFSVNINPLGLPQNVLEKLSASVSANENYPDRNNKKLIRALSEYRKVNENYLIAGNGASEIIDLAVRAVSPRLALLCAPTFSGYERSLRNSGSEIIYYDLKEEKCFSLQADFFNLLERNPDIVFLCNPNNPVGNLIDKTLLETILQYCEEHGIFTVLDECFLGFTDFHAELSSVTNLEKYPHLLVIDAFTKLFAMPGLRLGYGMSSNEKFVERMRQLKTEWSVSVPAETAGCEALKNNDYVLKTVKLISAERKFLCEQLERLGIKYFKSESNFLLFKESENLASFLYEKKIIIRSCKNMKGLDSSFYRICVSTHEKNARLIEALEAYKNVR